MKAHDVSSWTRPDAGESRCGHYRWETQTLRR